MNHDEIVAAIGQHFRTFGGGRTEGVEWNPLVSTLKDEPMQFAAGVDVSDVVRFVLRQRVRHLPPASSKGARQP